MESAEPDRPDPDRLLAQVQHEEERNRRGRLKIYLGAAPGVGKTFAMLSAARRRVAQGLETVVGCVETHGRSETAALLQGLEVLPRRAIEYRGTQLAEFDLDAALRRRPALLLVDELAHTNAPGTRFPKRWQDIAALLDAGIDVETTLNVQHVESLNDVFAQISGIRVRETVPDHVLDRAAEVVLVDLPPDVLLERLRGGKVYLPEVVPSAVERFFKKDNLTALRELALRRTAQWVDDQLRTLRRAQGVQRIWGTGDRILVAVGPSPLSARLVRAAHRTAVGLRAEWFAVFVDDPAVALGAAQRERVSAHLRLAESLGARTATIEGRDAAGAVIAFAREHDVARIVVGKSGRPRWRELLFGSFPLDVIRRSGDIDVHVVRSAETAGAPDVPAPAGRRGQWSTWREIAEAAVVVLGFVGAALLAYDPGDLSTEAMLLVLGTVVVALRCGRAAAVAAAVANALAFNLLFTEPRFTFAIADPGYVVAFVTMLVIGLVVTSLVSLVRERSASAQRRERESAVLYSLVRELSEAASEDEVGRTAVAHLRDLVPGELVWLVPAVGKDLDAGSVLASHGVPDWLGDADFAVARWSFDRGLVAGAGTDRLADSAGLFVPVAGRHGRVGVLAVRAAVAPVVLAPKTYQLVATCAEQAALAIERLRLRARQLDDQRVAETERLRSTLLASVSHDLRTPLSTITGCASSLLDPALALAPAARTALLEGILQEATRLNDLIANLVFATRLEAGAVALRREWTSVEEVVGSALRRAKPQLAERPVDVAVAAGLPLVQADPVLLEQALFLLLDNAAQHTPAGTRVQVRAGTRDGTLWVEVADDGPGVAPGQRDRAFERFARGPASAGMGLGLAICAAIAKAHGGSVALLAERPRGATFRLQLPVPEHQPQPPASEAAWEGAGAGDPT
ncbi:MAG: sensor histidine kinase KdpD [Planctomycetes bacterium]|nr:sensor histidine kinase KdpD [Planctomycetota bacterium]